MEKNNHTEIYKKYLNAKYRKQNISALAKELGITRSALYQIVKKFEKGNEYKINQCQRLARLACLWEFKFRHRYELLPANRKKETVVSVKKIVHEMKNEGYSVSLIAKYLQKDRATILHHLRHK